MSVGAHQLSEQKAIAAHMPTLMSVGRKGGREIRTGREINQWLTPRAILHVGESKSWKGMIARLEI